MKALPALILCALLGACSDGHFDDLKTFVRESGHGLQAKVPPAPEVKIYEPFAYAAFDLDDPFLPRKTQARADGVRPDLERVKEPLETYPLDALKMVGTLRQNQTVQAVIKAGDNDLYRVRAGNYIGQNFGRVVAIRDTEIELKELVQEADGEWTEHVATLTLQDQTQEQPPLATSR